MCPTKEAPSKTPTGVTMGSFRTQAEMGILRLLIRTDQPESTKRALALMAGITLCSCEMILTLAVWYQAVMAAKVDGTLVAALGVLSGIVAGLAGVAYYKGESNK